MDIIEYALQVAQSLVDMIAILVPSANDGTMDITCAGIVLACAIMGITHRALDWAQKKRKTTESL